MARVRGTLICVFVLTFTIGVCIAIVKELRVTSNGEIEVSTVAESNPSLVPTDSIPTNSSIRAVENSTCVETFDTFAYRASERKQDIQGKVIPPSYPWRLESVIPVERYGNGYSLSAHIEVIRSVNGRQEIWVTENSFEGNDEVNQVSFYVYDLDSRTWRKVSGVIESTGFFVEDLFALSNGEIWGKIASNHNLNSDRVPFWGKFNEHTQGFELVEVNSEWHFREKRYPNLILLDEKDIFWILIQEDGIYRFDPSTQVTERQVSLPNFVIPQAVLSPDGVIYFENNDQRGLSFMLSDRTLYQFLPETREISALSNPSEAWPIFSGMLVDQKGNLWLGAVGYHDPESGWRLMHPTPETGIVHGGDIIYATPKIILESSDGILWYHKYLDSSLQWDGTAWYDPQTGKGCLVTTVAANIIEDNDQRLWMVVDGNLYMKKPDLNR